MSRFIDVHAEKRKALKLFQAVEPCVELVGGTTVCPLALTPQHDALTGSKSYTEIVIQPDEIPGYAARMSHGSTGDAEANVKLTKKLLSFNPAHKTPFEFMQWIFKITGISKSCLTQMDRNRVGVGFRMRADNNNRELDLRIRSVLFELGASHAILAAEEYHRDVTYNDSHWSAAAERSFIALLDTYNITSEFIAYAKAYELKNRRTREIRKGNDGR